MDDSRLQEAFTTAVKAREKAHAPYSGFKVGAALALKGTGKIYPGCNVENASYGGTICAERTAMVSAVAEQGTVPFEFCVVVTDTEFATPPCALCLQVFSEFCPPDFPIYLGTVKEGIQKKVLLKELLPIPFNAIPE
ncbi:MAG: cytidine deaminase [Spirochaetes bacterium]|nr:MAG: cytidine deaminase [Spirochaetota bacterium]